MQRMQSAARRLVIAVALACGLAAAATQPGKRSSSLRLLATTDYTLVDPSVEEFVPISDGKSHGAGHDYNEETKISSGPIVIWSGESELPFSVECLIAGAWIILVGSMPVVMLRMEGKEATKTQWILSGTMWAVYGGGLYLFCNVIYFQSAHFDRERSLTTVECVYLMSQILTTVGYGDITPSRPRGQVFVGLYVVFAILIMANIVTEVSTLVVQNAADYADRLREAAIKFEDEKIGWRAAALNEARKARQEAANRISSSTDKLRHAAGGQSSSEPARADVEKDPETEHPGTATDAVGSTLAAVAPPVAWKPLIVAIVCFVSFCVMGWVFFVNYPGEGKTPLEGVYMSVITLSTVGFGVVTPVTEAGKVFAAFWMLFGTGALVNVITKFTELTIQLKKRERWDPKTDDATLKAANVVAAMPDRIDFGNFMIGCVARTHPDGFNDFKQIQAMWVPDEDGKVSAADLKSMTFIRKQRREASVGHGKFRRQVR